MVATVLGVGGAGARRASDLKALEAGLLAGIREKEPIKVEETVASSTVSIARVRSTGIT